MNTPRCWSPNQPSVRVKRSRDSRPKLLYEPIKFVLFLRHALWAAHPSPKKTQPRLTHPSEHRRQPASLQHLHGNRRSVSHVRILGRMDNFREYKLPTYFISSSFCHGTPAAFPPKLTSRGAQIMLVSRLGYRLASFCKA